MRSSSHIAAATLLTLLLSACDTLYHHQRSFLLPDPISESTSDPMQIREQTLKSIEVILRNLEFIKVGNTPLGLGSKYTRRDATLEIKLSPSQRVQLVFSQGGLGGLAPWHDFFRTETKLTEALQNEFGKQVEFTLSSNIGSPL